METNQIRAIIARNLLELRQSRGMTQLDLARRVNYSDKAVSKWERGESLPDVEVLLQIADIYHVSLDYLVSASHDQPLPSKLEMLKSLRRNHAFLICMSVLIILILALLSHICLDYKKGYQPLHLLVYLYAIPVALSVWICLNTLWFRGNGNRYIISGLVWSVLICSYISLLVFRKRSMPLILVLGIPGQLVTSLACRLKTGIAVHIGDK